MPLTSDSFLTHANAGAQVPAEPPLSSTAAVWQFADPGHRTVLCIEDDALHLRAIEETLADRAELTLLTAVQGSRALPLARSRQPDLILLDLDLADMSGEAVLASLLNDPLTGHIPVAVVSADQAPSRSDALPARGAVACLTKPLDTGRLVSLIDATLRVSFPHPTSPPMTSAAPPGDQTLVDGPVLGSVSPAAK